MGSMSSKVLLMSPVPVDMPGAPVYFVAKQRSIKVAADGGLKPVNTSVAELNLKHAKELATDVSLSDGVMEVGVLFNGRDMYVYSCSDATVELRRTSIAAIAGLSDVRVIHAGFGLPVRGNRARAYLFFTDAQNKPSWGIFDFGRLSATFGLAPADRQAAFVTGPESALTCPLLSSLNGALPDATVLCGTNVVLISNGAFSQVALNYPEEAPSARAVPRTTPSFLAVKEVQAGRVVDRTPRVRGRTVSNPRDSNDARKGRKGSKGARTGIRAVATTRIARSLSSGSAGRIVKS